MSLLIKFIIFWLVGSVISAAVLEALRSTVEKNPEKYNSAEVKDFLSLDKKSIIVTSILTSWVMVVDMIFAAVKALLQKDE